MSFSQAIKDDLCRSEADLREQELELATALLLNARFYSTYLTLASSHERFTERLLQDFDRVLGLEGSITKGRELFTIRVEGREALDEVADFLADVLSFDTLHGRFTSPAAELSAEDERHILKYMYLAGGSVSEPSRAYHMELACRRLQVARFCLGLLERHEINGSLLKRYGYNVVYLKDGQQIADFLGLVGAHVSLLQFESLRVEKEMRNTVNRMVNCDTANARRIANTAARQLEALSWYDEIFGLDKLPEDLEEAARVRLDNPAHSLVELGELLDPPLGKSGMNHRLQKLERIIAKEREAYEAGETDQTN